MYLTPSLELIIKFNKQTKIFEYSFVKESKYSKAAIHFSTKIYPDIEFFI